MKKLKILYYYLRHKYRRIDSLADYQDKAFEKLRKNVLSLSPFYKEHKEFGYFPIINKKVMMDNFDKLNTKGLSKEACFETALKAETERDFSPRLNDVTVGLSSGTSGNRGLFLADETEEAMWAGHILAKTLHEGLFGTYNIAFFLRANSNLYENVNALKIRMNYYDLKLDIKVLMEKLAEQNPSVIIAPAQVLVHVAKKQAAGELNLSPERIYYVAEVLDDADRAFVEETFGITLDTIYQATEGFLGITCKHKRLHLNEEDLIIEKEFILDNRFYPIITDLRRRSQPIVRYKLDDILVMDEDQTCSCGHKGTIIKKIEGRKDDAFLFKKHDQVQTVFPDLLRQEIIKLAPDIENYKANQTSFDSVTFYVTNPSEELKASIESLFNNYSDAPIAVTFENYVETKIENKLRRLERTFNYE